MEPCNFPIFFYIKFIAFEYAFIIIGKNRYHSVLRGVSSPSCQLFFTITNRLSTFNPYIVYIFKEYKDNENVIIEKLCELEKYVMWHLITKASTKNFNKDCSEFIKDKSGEAIKEKLSGFNSDELKAGLSKVTNKLASIILFWVELKRRQDPKYDTRILQYIYQLEHIMPQKWEEFWKDVPYVDENGNQLPDNDESKIKRYAKVYSLGNMTLLSGRLNSAISNDIFKKKMEGNGKKKGIKAYSSLYYKGSC